MRFERLTAKELHLEQFMAGISPDDTKVLICVGNDSYVVASPSEDTPGTELEKNFLRYLGKGKPVLYSTAITACFMPWIILSQSQLSSQIYYRDSNTPYLGEININDFFMNIRERLENIVLEEMIDAL